MSLPEDVLDVIGKALGDGIENYELDLHRGNKKEVGYLGEVIFVTAINKKNKEEIDLVVKKIVNYSRGAGAVIKQSFRNEIFFYDTYLKEFMKFQESSSEIFNKFPRCYAVCTVEKEEKIVLENLQTSGFQLLNSRTPVDQTHMEFVFKTYAQFHGISFAFKQTNPEDYKHFGEQLVDVMEILITSGVIPNLNRLFEEYLIVKGDSIDNDEIKTTCEKYAENGMKLFSESLKYNGDYPIIIHGDCHSLNMLFKYDNDNKPIDMRLLDFQLSKYGTPAFDLSYCLYASGAPEIYNDFEHYLKIYHDTLTDTLKLYNLDSNEIYPYESLKIDWKSNGLFGFIMGIYVWMGRFIHEPDVKDLDEYRRMREKMKEASQDENLKRSPFMKPGFLEIFENFLQHGHKEGVL